QGSSPSLLWDQFQIGRRVFVTTKDGRVLPGVVAAPNTHFRRGDDVPIPEATVDDIWVDVGAETDKQAHAMGIENLCLVSQVGNVSLDRSPDNKKRWTGPGETLVMGSRIAMELSGDQSRSNGGTIVAWVAQGSAGGRGAENLARLWKPDRAIVLSPYAPAVADSGVVPTRVKWEPYVLVSGGSRADSLWQQQVAKRLSAVSTSARPQPRGTLIGRLGIPVAHGGVVARYVGSPGEFPGPKDYPDDADGLVMVDQPPLRAISSWPPTTPDQSTHRSTWEVLAPLVHAQGISEHEEAVRDTVLSLIPRSF